MARAINIQLIIEETQSALDIPSYSEHDKGFDDGLKYVLGLIEKSPTFTPPNEPERVGLYGKYTVYKNKDGSLVTDCFILRPAKDPAAVAALRAYAATTDNAELAADIINWVGAEPNEPLTLEQLREMDGEPVYIVFSPDVDGEKLQFWALVAVDKWGEVYLMNNLGGSSAYEEAWANIEAIYRRPPEGEEDT